MQHNNIKMFVYIYVIIQCNGSGMNEFSGEKLYRIQLTYLSIKYRNV